MSLIHTAPESLIMRAKVGTEHLGGVRWSLSGRSRFPDRSGPGTRNSHWGGLPSRGEAGCQGLVSVEKKRSKLGTRHRRGATPGE